MLVLFNGYHMHGEGLKQVLKIIRRSELGTFHLMLLPNSYQ